MISFVDFRKRVLAFVEECVPDVDESAQVIVAQKVFDTLWPAVNAAQKLKTTITLPRNIVERAMRTCALVVLDDWRRGIVDSQARKLVAVLDEALGNPIRVWPDEGGPEDLDAE